MNKTVHSPESQALVAQLKRIRRDSGLNQRQLADKLGWQQSKLAKIEIGERRIDLIEYLRLLEAAGADARDCVDEIINLLTS